MSTTEQRLAANRTNALSSTGPITTAGKAVASQNATRHGLLSAKLLLEDEDPDDYQMMLADLCRSVRPVGALELSLVERIGVTLWRQRRLVQAETARLTLARQSKKIADGVSSELGCSYTNEISQDNLEPFDETQETWCRNVVDEIEALDEIDMKSLEHSAPLVFVQLESDAEEDGDDLAKFVADQDGGLTGYVAGVLNWCREQLLSAEARPKILALAEQVRAKRLVLPTDVLEVLARYQTTLDNQLYKALRALREAQEWRLKTLDQSPVPDAADFDEVAQAA